MPSSSTSRAQLALGQIAAYLRAHISRFGAYATDELCHRPDPFDPLLKEVDFTDVELAA
ncbi:hypothetical protein ACIBHX_14330 [Nonomuraea sp. NPDC050536]|uniref:hypothetical protein n=1 Tax=Nonomuraea sp. NPDC050536 TaxID=3364366 RepID=UPI0037C67E7A